MKQLRVLAVLLAGLLMFAMPVAAAEKGAIVDSVALVSDYDGTALIKANGSKEWKAAELNMPVYEGDEFKTEDKSYLEITFDDATMIRLDNNANLRIDTLSRTNGIAKTIFNLMKGKVLALVDKLRNEDSTFQVKTKMAIAAVKGTSLVCNDDGSTGVIDGLVKVIGVDENGNEINFSMVEKGKEIFFEGRGQFGKVGEFSDAKWNITKELGGMKEEIAIVKEHKNNGTLQEYRIKRQKLKNGEVVGESETEIQVGGAGDTKKVESRINDFMKTRLQGEFAKERMRAYDDLKFVNGEMKADLHLGKSMIDVHGNRIRIEEYIFRPAGNQVDLLSITLRDNRIDYLRAQNIFNKDIPKNMPKEIWQNQWYANKPTIWKTQEKLTLSNTIDSVRIHTIYIDNDPDYGPAVTALNGNTWKIFLGENTVSINDDIKQHTVANINTVVNGYHTYPMEKVADDKTFATYSEAVAAGSILGSGEFVAANTVGSWLNNDKGKLAWDATTTYNDGSNLRIRLYLIDDYGDIIPTPTRLLQWVSLLFDANVEMQLNSNQFVDQGLGIDIVSKILWYCALNPKQ